MQISVTELVTMLVVYTAMTGSGIYWLWHRALTQRPARRWAAALVVMPVPAIIAPGRRPPRLAAA